MVRLRVKGSLFALDPLRFSLLSPTPPGNYEQFASYGAERRWHMVDTLWKVCLDDEAQDIAEYAVMLAVILVIVVGTIRLVGSNANNVFSSVASAVQ